MTADPWVWLKYPGDEKQHAWEADQSPDFPWVAYGDEPALTAPRDQLAVDEHAPQCVVCLLAVGKALADRHGDPRWRL